MINGLGIDAVDIHRFVHWHTVSKDRLNRIFSAKEIAYCLANKALSAQRFATRFATKEAFFKSWNSALPDHYAPFLTFCRAVSLEHGVNNSPKLSIRWDLLPKINGTITPLISLTHTHSMAIACVFLQLNSA